MYWTAPQVDVFFGKPVINPMSTGRPTRRNLVVFERWTECRIICSSIHTFAPSRYSLVATQPHVEALVLGLQRSAFPSDKHWSMFVKERFRLIWSRPVPGTRTHVDLSFSFPRGQWSFKGGADKQSKVFFYGHLGVLFSGGRGGVHGKRLWNRVGAGPGDGRVLAGCVYCSYHYCFLNVCVFLLDVFSLF